MFGLTLVGIGKGLYSVDEFRWGIERMPDYVAASYYERWLASYERNLVEQGILREGELDERARELAERPRELERADDPGWTAWFLGLMKGAGTPSVEPVSEPQFAVGDRVRTTAAEPRGHTRLPAYARGKPGTIAIVQGCYLVPDRRALREGEEPQWVYAVRFDARDLWDERAEPNEVVHIDLWESYLEGAAWATTTTTTTSPTRRCGRARSSRCCSRRASSPTDAVDRVVERLRAATSAR